MSGWEYKIREGINLLALQSRHRDIQGFQRRKKKHTLGGIRWENMRNNYYDNWIIKTWLDQLRMVRSNAVRYRRRKL